MVVYAVIAAVIAGIFGLVVWLIKRSEKASKQAAEDRAGSVESAAEIRDRADDVLARPVPLGERLLERVRKRSNPDD